MHDNQQNYDSKRIKIDGSISNPHVLTDLAACDKFQRMGVGV